MTHESRGYGSYLWDGALTNCKPRASNRRVVFRHIGCIEGDERHIRGHGCWKYKICCVF